MRNEFVRLPENFPEEWIRPEAWLRPEDEEILMAPEEIEAFNLASRPELRNGEGISMLMEELGDTLPGSRVKAMMDLHRLSEVPSAIYADGRPAEPELLRSVEENTARELISDSVPVRFGFSVARGMILKFPTEVFFSDDPEDHWFDANAVSECAPLLPVAVLHESRDGAWLYCLFYNMGGWVRRELIALCPDRADWLRRQHPEHVLTVVGRELRLEQDPLCPALSGLLLPMGTHMPLLTAEEAPLHLRGRISWNHYTVLLPIRRADGGIGDELCLISAESPVVPGFLPYSRAALLRLAFSRLGAPYGWGGTLMSNDCSGTLRELFCCFGFVLPRNAREQAALKTTRGLDLAGRTAGQKMEALKNAAPGDVVYMPGHIVLFLGVREGKAWGLSAVGSFCSGGRKMPVMNVCVNDFDARRKNGQTWLESATRLFSVLPRET